MYLKIFPLSLMITGLCMISSSQARPERQTLSELGRYYGFPRPARTKREWVFQSDYTRMVFHGDSRRLLYNGYLIWLNAAVNTDESDSDRWTISRRDAETVIDPLLRTELILKDANVAVVVLDPGHGGNDTGAIGNDDAPVVEQARLR